MDIQVEGKRCTGCNTIKPLSEYWRHPQGKDRYQARCKPCLKVAHSEQKSRRLARNPLADIRRFRRSILQRYGITIEEYDRMLEEQNGKCLICGRDPDVGISLAVDHDHVTGVVRGLLHLRCNTAIGLLMDSPELCRKAADYLERSLG